MYRHNPQLPHCLGQLVRKKTIYYAKETNIKNCQICMIRGKYKLLVYAETGIINMLADDQIR